MRVRVEEGVLQIFERRVIQVELPLQRAIRHAPTALEHGEGLVQNLLEGHSRPSTTLARVPRESKVHQGGVYRGRAPRVYQQYRGVAGEIAPLGRVPRI